MGATIEIYKDRGGEFRFRVKAKNGEIVASGESYATKAGAERGVKAMAKAVKNARVVDLVEENPADE